MSQPTIPAMVNRENAQKISLLPIAVIDAILRLSSLGLRSDAIIEYCTRAAEGEAPSVQAGGGAKPLTIQAYSFLSDKSICVDKYGMELSEAAKALATLKTSPEEGLAIVRKAVTDYQAKRESLKPVVVTLTGLPSSKGGPKVSGDGGRAELSELMRRHQAAAGAYSFTAVEHGPTGPEKFKVLLGGNLAVVGQSKLVAQRAAQLVRVLGRKHPVLVKYIRLHVPGKPLTASDKIKASIYSGILPPDDALPKDETPTGSTTG